MAKFVLSMDGLVLKEYTITKERTTIGRRPHNDIQIDNLAVSGEHAVIVTILNDSFLEDLGSTNGTLVNGQPVKKHFLQNNDVVELGKYKLKYFNEAPAAMRGQDFEKTMVLRPRSAPNATQPVRAAPAAAVMNEPVGAMVAPPPPATRRPAPDAPRNAPAPQPAALSAPTGAQAIGGASAVAVAVIQVLSGASAGRELELVKPLTRLGKPDVQVAVIARRPQGYFITHVEGAVFPVVNGRTLDAQAHLLNDHDVIELAGVKMEFYFRS